MLSSLTPAALRALEAAARHAGRRERSEASPVDLLFGLLQEPEGRAALLLQRAGVPLTAAHEVIGWPTDQAEDEAVPSAPLGAAVHAILDQALELASQYRLDRSVSGELVLIALLRHHSSLRGLLQERGLDMARLEEQRTPTPDPALPLDEALELHPPTEQIDAARILDANANRAREALRVVEDYCRFVLDDAFLSRQLKQLRHDLTQALADLPSHLLLAARETQHDVGVHLSTSSEGVRFSLLAVVRANLKRMQEALRSLEEFGKFALPQLGQALEQMRYRAYTLERAILLGAEARQRLANARLMVLLSGAECLASLEWTIAEAAAGGADVIQLREKHLDDRRLLERARDVRRWTRQASVLFVVNDRPDVARLVEADGVHLGQEDMLVKDARRILGPEALIGVSTHDLAQVRQAIRDGASYIGVGPTFSSGTKQFDDLAGLEFVRQARAETSLPAFIIGGVNPSTIAAAAAAGARRVAVSQAIAQSDDPRSTAAALRRVVE